MTFVKGQSGNPAGRPKGSAGRAKRLMLDLMEGDAETVTRKLVDSARKGDLLAIRLVIDRLCPPPRDRTVSFALPRMETAADAVAASAAVVAAVAAGELSPREACDVVQIVGTYVRAIETADLAVRIDRLEEERREELERRKQERALRIVP
jgi:hypothetical protein